MTELFFETKARERIETAVQKAEGMSSVEIVPMVVERSASYAAQPWVAGSIALFVESLWLFYLSYKHPWSFTPLHFMASQASAFLIAYWLAKVPTLRRLLVSARVRRGNVERAAHAQFLAAGLAETRERTGILLYVSLFERSVRILADKGVSEKLGDAYWKTLAAELAKALAEGEGLEALENAIVKIGEEAKAHFPRTAQDKNELPNALRREEKF